MISIDPYSRSPIYEQVVKRICELIMVGELKKDDKLPSVRSLARDLGVNPNTVQKAYAELERGNMIYTVSGKGNFVGERDAVAGRICGELLNTVREAIVAAYNHAIPMAEIMRLVEKVYQSGGEEQTV